MKIRTIEEKEHKIRGKEVCSILTTPDLITFEVDSEENLPTVSETGSSTARTRTQEANNKHTFNGQANSYVSQSASVP